MAAMSSIKEFAKLLKEAQTQQKEAKVLDNFSKLLKETAQTSITNDRIVLETETERRVIVEKPPVDTITDIFVEEVSTIEKIANSIPVKKIIENIESERWDDPLRRNSSQKFVTFKEMNDHYTNFLGRIQQQLTSVGGGGEVKFRYLDDVNRSTMLSSNDNYVLEYDATSGKVQFTNQIGPIDRIKFDLNHAHDEIRTPGTLCWSPEDLTLNLEHPGGVTQQIGQEMYGYVRNGTANTIPNGTAVQFSGAEQNGTARLLVAPMLANGAFPSLYGLGITTQDIEPGEDGMVTVWGKVREIDTTGGAEDWQVGDVLYVSPIYVGELTKVKPTAPNNVIPMAAVLKVDSTEGELFVRPTISQQESYGRFARTTTQTANTINTGYPIVFDDTEITNGVTIGSPASQIVVNQSGFYQFDVSLEVEATSNKGVVYVWFRKNGNDIALSSRSNTITNGDVFAVSSTLQVSLAANDWVEVVWAKSAAGIQLKANATPVVGPSVASALLSVGQIQL
jgi:hypothetical protein